jgi:hypothetical protein
MRIGALLGFAALAAFVTYCFRRNDELRAARRTTREEIGRWESEGGNVPAVATPSPAPVPTTGYPQGGDPNVRH